jgi:hypothetical protein
MLIVCGASLLIYTGVKTQWDGSRVAEENRVIADQGRNESRSGLRDRVIWSEPLNLNSGFYRSCVRIQHIALKRCEKLPIRPGGELRSDRWFGP